MRPNITPPLWLDLLRTPMAAPETRSLHRMRRTWQILCVACALIAGGFVPLHRLLGPAAPILAVVLLSATLLYSALYLAIKQDADAAFLDRAGEAE